MIFLHETLHKANDIFICVSGFKPSKIINAIQIIQTIFLWNLLV